MSFLTTRGVGLLCDRDLTLGAPAGGGAMKLLDGEKIILHSDSEELVLSTQRVRLPTVAGEEVG